MHRRFFRFLYSAATGPGSSPEMSAAVRQRHSQGEDEAEEEVEEVSSKLSRVEKVDRPGVMVALVWVVFAGFMVYVGDQRENLVAILWSDERVRRTPLYIGLAGGLLNVGLILFAALFSRGPQKSSEKYEALLSTAPSVVVLGLFSFCLISYALWPIWGILTILLLITFFMSFMVILSNLMSGPFEPETICDARVLV